MNIKSYKYAVLIIILLALCDTKNQTIYSKSNTMKMEFFRAIKNNDSNTININSYNSSNIPKPWSVCQMWPNNPNTGPYISGADNPGHNFIVMDVHKYSGRVLTLESRGSGYDAGQSGPQYRWIGNIGDNMPGQFWYTDNNCWEVRKFYAYLKYNKMAQLRIYNRHFIENSTEDDTPDDIKNGILEGGC